MSGIQQLRRAIETGTTDEVRRLVAAAPTLTLHLAAYVGHPAVAERLLAAGADAAAVASNAT